MTENAKQWTGKGFNDRYCGHIETKTYNLKGWGGKLTIMSYNRYQMETQKKYVSMF